MQKKILIVGGGLGGLATACRLAARGHKIILLEKNLILGGKAGSYEVGGYIFQPMPCFLDNTDELSRLFFDLGRRIEDYLEFVELQPFYKVFYEDKRWAEYIHEGNSAHLLVLDDGKNVLLDEIFHPNELSFITGSPWGDETNIIRKTIRLVKTLGESYLSVQKFLAQRLPNPLLYSALVAPMVFQGVDPGQVSLRYALKTHLLFPPAMYYPLGGLHTIVEGLAQIFQELGGKIIYQAEVEQIIVHHNKVTGVRLVDGQKLYADYVICDANREYTFRKFLKRPIAKWSKNQFAGGPSAFIFCFGLKREIPDGVCLHHNFFLSSKFGEMVRTVFRENTFPAEIFFYLSAPTTTDPGLAPKGGSIYQVVVPVPNLEAEADWGLMLSVFRDQIVKIIEGVVMPDFRREIAVEFTITPKDFSERFSFPLGSFYRDQPSFLEQMGIPSSVQTGYRNLFVIGGEHLSGRGISVNFQKARKIDSLIP